MSQATDVHAALAAAPRVIEGLVAELVTTTVDRIASETRRRSPGKRVTDGIRVEHRGDGFQQTGRVYLAGVAIPVAKGQRPHRIPPKEGHALRFANGGFAAAVDHPGAPSNPFFRDAVAAVVASVDEDLARVRDQALREISDGITTAR